MFKYFILFLLLTSIASAKEYAFRGEWHTEGRRKLNGTMTCIVKKVEKQWQGRFFGTWQGVDFDYTEKLNGKLNNLSGKTVIDGASYDWKGKINKNNFNATFTGDRYNGGFQLKRVEK